MSKLVPAISSNVTGPLGVAHLPRLWLKAILNAKGLLAEGYNSGYRGMDRWLMDDLAVEFEPFYAFLATLPTYLETEVWVRAHAGKLDAAAIAAHNERVRGFDMPDENADPKRAALGIDSSVTKGVMINDLDDWAGLHALVSA